MSWHYTSLATATSYGEKWQSGRWMAGIGIHTASKYKTFGLDYELGIPKLSLSGDAFSRRMTEHNLLFSYSNYLGPIAKQDECIVFKFSCGLSSASAKDMASYFTRYSSPRTLNSHWLGGMVGLSGGLSLDLTESYRLNLLVNARFGYSELTKANLESSSIQPQASGIMRTYSFGLQVELLRIRQKKEPVAK